MQATFIIWNFVSTFIVYNGKNHTKFPVAC